MNMGTENVIQNAGESGRNLFVDTIIPGIITLVLSGVIIYIIRAFLIKSLRRSDKMEEKQKVRLVKTVTTFLAIVAIVHTGVSYYLYFGSLQDLPAQSIAMISYIDPVIAILCSVLIMAQTPTVGEIIGAVLILGAAICSELPIGKQVKT